VHAAFSHRAVGSTAPPLSCSWLRELGKGRGFIPLFQPNRFPLVSRASGRRSERRRDSSHERRMSGESKKEEFRKYLERSGVIDALTKVLVALYEEPEKPANALDFIKQYLGAPTSGDVETMKAEKDELVKKNEELTKNLEVQCAPLSRASGAHAPPMRTRRCLTRRCRARPASAARARGSAATACGHVVQHYLASRAVHMRLQQRPLTLAHGLGPSLLLAAPYCVLLKHGAVSCRRCEHSLRSCKRVKMARRRGAFETARGLSSWHPCAPPPRYVLCGVNRRHAQSRLGVWVRG